jgi:hypothetical protein
MLLFFFPFMPTALVQSYYRSLLVHHIGIHALGFSIHKVSLGLRHGVWITSLKITSHNFSDNQHLHQIAFMDD